MSFRDSATRSGSAIPDLTRVTRMITELEAAYRDLVNEFACEDGTTDLKNCSNEVGLSEEGSW